MSDDEVTEGLAHFKVARRRLMRAARVADRLHAPIAHIRLMFAVDALDDAEEAFKEATGYRRLMEDMYPPTWAERQLPPLRGRFARTAQEIDALPELEES